MKYAQIKDGIIKNTIVLNDPTLEPLCSSGFDHLIRIDELKPMPGIGWTYDGTTFIKPLPKLKK